MGTHARWVTATLVGGALIASAHGSWLRANAPAAGSPAQAETPRLPTEVSNVQFNAGQSVVPYFEGWIRNPDGTFDLVFGYFNRNWKQEFVIPPGPGNTIEPGAAADVGQPTYFLPRRQRWVFRHRVPADFGKKVVTWTITANGRTEKAYGDLLPAEELTERVVMTNGSFDPGEGDPNTPPAITLAPIQNVVAGAPVALIASVTDDGLPKRRAAAPAPVSPSPAAGAGGAGPITAQVNSSGQRPRGLTVTWLQYRGPGKITFSAAGPTPVANGQVSTTATFPVPGTYVFRANANDGQLSRGVEMTVHVTGAGTTPGPSQQSKTRTHIP
jgi:hypothetical protein